MTTQSEAILENNLVEQLTDGDYAVTHLDNDEQHTGHLKAQLEKVNFHQSN